MSDKIPQYVTPYKYAKLCGVSPTAINQRIKKQQLPIVELANPDGSIKRYIDTIENPPMKTIEELRNYPIEFKGVKKKEEK